MIPEPPPSTHHLNVLYFFCFHGAKNGTSGPSQQLRPQLLPPSAPDVTTAWRLEYYLPTSMVEKVVHPTRATPAVDEFALVPTQDEYPPPRASFLLGRRCPPGSGDAQGLLRTPRPPHWRGSCCTPCRAKFPSGISSGPVRPSSSGISGAVFSLCFSSRSCSDKGVTNSISWVVSILRGI